MNIFDKKYEKSDILKLVGKVENRRVLREKGTLPFLQPGEEKKMLLEIGVLEGKKEIEDFVDKVRKLV